MTAETKQFIETHINMIENNGMGSIYLDCPLRILNDFNNTMHIAGLEYPPEVHTYVVICCYISKRFAGAILKQYDFYYKTEKEEFEFICDNCIHSVEQLTRDLSMLLPKNSINADIKQYVGFRGTPCIKIRVTVD